MLLNGTRLIDLTKTIFEHVQLNVALRVSAS